MATSAHLQSKDIHKPSGYSVDAYPVGVYVASSVFVYGCSKFVPPISKRLANNTISLVLCVRSKTNPNSGPMKRFDMLKADKLSP